MIPILFENTETAFANNGIGRLDCISCLVTEQRNGIYECEFVYPISGPRYNDIKEGRIILATHDSKEDPQPFEIYGRSAPIDGLVTFRAHHISYRLSGKTVKPFSSTGCAETLAAMKYNTIGSNEFDFWTDKDVRNNYSLKVPGELRPLLGGRENSILDVFGTGEYEFDKFEVKLWTKRGEDKDVEIRYGKNLEDLKQEIDFSGAYNGIVPYWNGTDEDGNEITVTLPEAFLRKGDSFDGYDRYIPKDFSGDFEAAPTVAELRTKAQKYLDDNDPRLPIQSLEVKYVDLSQTEEYKNFKNLEKANLCDTVRIVFYKLGIDIRMKIVETVYNTLKDRYEEITLGDVPKSYAQEITERLSQEAALNHQLARWAQGWATNALKIAGNTDQYFWFMGTGSDTGAHITEIPKEEFLTDPTHGGGNLLARSNGIAIRIGLLERALFGLYGAQIGLDEDTHSRFTDRAFILEKGAELFTEIGIMNGDDGNLHLQYNFAASTATTINAGFNIVSIVSAKYSDNTDVEVTASGSTFTITNRKNLAGVIDYITDSPVPHYDLGQRTAATNRGAYSMVEGMDNTASGQSSHAEGETNIASGRRTHVEGYNNTANANDSHAEGDSNTTNGANSHAEGFGNTVDGTNSHAEGESNTASGNQAHVEGYSNSASGNNTHVEGFSNAATQTNAHAEGWDNTASGNQAHAEGMHNVVSGDNAHANGENLIAKGRNQTVIGHYNVGSGTKDSYAPADFSFLVGNGMSSNRSNSFGIRNNGNACVQGGVWVGCNADLSGGKELGKEESYWGNNSGIISSSTSLSKLADMFTVPEGTWVITASVRFPAKATGTRAAEIGINDTKYGSSYVARSAVGNGIEALETTLVIHVSESSTVNLYARQSSGANMEVSYVYRATRIN